MFDSHSTVNSQQSTTIRNESYSATLMVSLPAIEMLKGLGVWEENPQVSIPLFANYLEVPKIAQEICEFFALSPPKVPALLIRDRGVTVWANSPAAAYNYIEIVEYIFRYVRANQSILDDKF